jgi:hypothetical protein
VPARQQALRSTQGLVCRSGGLGAATASTSACVRGPGGRGCGVAARAAQQEQQAQAQQDEQQQQQQQKQQQQGQHQMGRQQTGGPHSGGATTYQLPPHWKTQIDKAPMGKKRVLQRWVRMARDYAQSHLIIAQAHAHAYAYAHTHPSIHPSIHHNVT